MRLKIGEILVKNKSISKETLELALEKQNEIEPKKKIGELLNEDLNAINEEKLYQALAEQHELKYIELEKYPLDMNIISSYSFDTLHKYKFIPFKNSDEKLYHVIYDPTALDLLDELALYLKTPLNLVMAKKESVI